MSTLAMVPDSSSICLEAWSIEWSRQKAVSWPQVLLRPRVRREEAGKLDGMAPSATRRPRRAPEGLNEFSTR
jgi:hypothetical protein